MQQGAQDLTAARQQAQQADVVKASFLSTVGQQLREPVDSIDGSASTLLQGLAGPVSADQQRQLHQLQAGARQLRALVNEMLDIVRIDAGSLQLQREAFDLSETIHKAAAAARPRAQDKGLALQLQLADDLGYARGDERRLEQVLAKLLDNAIQFTAAGSVTVTAQALADGMLRIAITDTGMGMAADTLGGLFQPFQQATAARADGEPGQRGNGVGLGLAIAQRLARRMGGSINAASTPAQGSTFTLLLPSDSAALAARG